MEKLFPSLFLPRYFFFGIICIKEYGYTWSYSNAYMEIMMMDTTVTDFSKKKEKKEPTREECEETVRKWREKMEREQRVKMEKNLQQTAKIKL